MEAKFRKGLLAKLELQTATFPKVISDCNRCGVTEMTHHEDSEFMCDPCAKYVAK